MEIMKKVISLILFDGKLCSAEIIISTQFDDFIITLIDFLRQKYQDIMLLCPYNCITNPTLAGNETPQT
jgi:hypothetical protein